MRNIYLSLSVILASSTLLAQSSYFGDYTAKNKNVKSSKQQPARLKASYLSEDFESGTFPPAGWTEYSGSSSTITTAEQEWHANSGGNPGSCASVLFDNATDVHDEYLETPAIDLSTPSSSTVHLQFDFNTSIHWHVAPNDFADISLFVSTDNGATWSDTLWVEDDTTLLEATHSNDWEQYEWTTAYVDISNFTGAGMNQVKFAFHYTGQDGAQFNLDNVVVLDALSNNLAVADVFDANFNQTQEFSELPTSQTSIAQTGAVIVNKGTQTQYNVSVAIDISGSTSGSVYTETIVLDSIEPYDKDTIWTTNSTYTPSVIESLTETFTLPTDEEGSDNVGTSTYNITEFTMSHYKETTSTRTFDDDDLIAVGASYLITSEVTLYEVDVKFEQGTSTNELYTLRIHEVLSGIQDVNELLALDYNVAPSDIGNWTSIRLATPVTLEANKEYIIEIESDFAEDKPIVLSANNGGNPDLSTTVYGPFGTNNAVNRYLGWGFVPAIRLDFENYGVGIKENEALVTLSQNRPNPAKGQTVIGYVLNEKSDVTLKITDINGKVIFTNTEINQAKGKHAINVNTNEMSQGVYQYTITTNQGTITKSMVVAK
ncbi:MAG: T9SS type A sorting domain-containing protein [Flavobacteriales bacterium]|jgi:hypothetical protein|nr:T9SS type A sorting domain-containing protein [Flavobacteriales bacterium]